jgi:hypothetical protein
MKFTPQRQTAATTKYAAPVGGINAITNLSEMSFKDAIYSFNMVPSRYGMVTRNGYVEHCTNVGTGGVRTIIPYSGTTILADKLFACASDGIYDVTTSSAAPTLKIAFGTVDPTSGYGIWVIFTNLAGAKFICYTDESNGYYVYTESTDTWLKIALGAGATQISGVDPASFAFVMIWKQRLWFVQKNTGTAWYLTVGALFGAATPFEFGNKFKYGGDLRAIYNWTVDGGVGVDDYLVALSGAGDVVVYQGTDPNVASSFEQRGVYYIGSLPAYRRIAGTFGGELYLLSTYGLLPITKLLSGQTIMDRDIFVSDRITPVINIQMALSRNQIGWEVRFIPSQTVLLLSAPKQINQDYLQFAQGTDTKGWGIYRDLPYTTGDTWQGNLYIGDEDSRVLFSTGGLDEVTLADPDTSGVEIEFSMLTSFQDLEAPGGNKIAQFIRATFIGQAVPSYQAVARYDYNIIEPLVTVPVVVPTGDVWDVGMWDSAIWGGDFVVSNALNGASGMGRSLAIAVRGSSSVQTTLVKFDVTFTQGNVL